MSNSIAIVIASGVLLRVSAVGYCADSILSITGRQNRQQKNMTK